MCKVSLDAIVMKEQHPPLLPWLFRKMRSAGAGVLAVTEGRMGGASCQKQSTQVLYVKCSACSYTYIVEAYPYPSPVPSLAKPHGRTVDSHLFVSAYDPFLAEVFKGFKAHSRLCANH